MIKVNCCFWNKQSVDNQMNGVNIVKHPGLRYKLCMLMSGQKMNTNPNYQLTQPYLKNQPDIIFWDKFMHRLLFECNYLVDHHYSKITCLKIYIGNKDSCSKSSNLYWHT
ncbi:hypothetical protein ACI65C_008870 [Semiaphis heraclei]